MKEKNSDFELNFLERLVQKNPEFVDALIPLAEEYTRRGQYEEGLKIDQRLSKLKQKDPTVHYNLACSHALVGNKEEAIQNLQKAVELGYRDFEHLLKDSDLKLLRSDSRFKSLIAKFLP